MSLFSIQGDITEGQVSVALPPPASQYSLMRFNSLITTSVVLATGDQECNYALELLALQDGSDSFAEHVDLWASTAGDFIERLGQNFEEFKIGLSSFTDKPIPKSGYGTYGGWAQYKQDYCYARHVPLTDSVERMTEGLNELKQYMGSGMDGPEAQAEAMIYAALDTSIGWSDPSVTHSNSGRPIVRVLLMITDARAHEQDDARENINQFNAPRSYPNGYEQPSTGGFGAHSFLNKRYISAYLDSDSAALYTELADLFAKSDQAESEGSALSYDDVTRMRELTDLWGPYPYPDTLIEHPGDDSIADCSQTEYPSLTQAMNALASRDVLPVILTSTQDAYAFYEWYQSNVFSVFNVSTIVSMFDSASLFDDMITAINDLVEKHCLVSPSKVPETEQSSTTDAPEITDLVSTVTSDDSNEAAATEDANGYPTETTGAALSHIVTEAPLETYSSPIVPKETDEAPLATQNEETPERETEDTETDLVEPPVIPEGKSNTGTIAGACAGAVAGVAGLAALLYRQIGASAFPTNSGPSIDMGEQIEASENALEREAIEEVTMDMFH